MPAITRAAIDQLNERICGELDNPSMIKTANDNIDDYTRTRVREESYARKIMPYSQVSNSELDRQYWTEKPVKVFDMEGDSPGAISVPFGATPTNHYISFPRYMVGFERLLTPKFMKDMEELRTNTADVRQIVSDNAIKDMMAEEDSKFTATVNTALLGQNTVLPYTGTAMWVRLPGGINRRSFEDAKKIMKATPFHIHPTVALVNNVTIHEFMKWDRVEAGGDISERFLTKGWTETNFSGLTWIITNKRDLVPDNRMYLFADPSLLGKALFLEDITFFMKREAWYLEFFAYEVIGQTFAHTGGMSIIDF